VFDSSEGKIESTFLPDLGKRRAPLTWPDIPAPKMTRSEAMSVLTANTSNPIFNVKIGMGPPLAKNVTFQDALAVFDGNINFRNKEEYVFIYCSTYVDYEIQNKVNEALSVWDLGQYDS